MLNIRIVRGRSTHDTLICYKLYSSVGIRYYKEHRKLPDVTKLYGGFTTRKSIHCNK